MKTSADALVNVVAFLCVVVATYLVTAAAAAAWVTMYRCFLRMWA